MIAIVIVSHSRDIADGLKRMADAMSSARVPIMAAGGMDEPDNPLGTDALLILQAIQSVLNEDGVLVFADIGSAKLNAETAIDLLDENQKEKVQFCDAPLVEGVLAAAIQSAGGGALDDVMREAQTAYIPAQVTTELAAQVDKTPPHSQSALRREYDIVNPLGLHARPAARFVTAMNAFASDVRLRNITSDSAYENAKSINKVMTLEVLRDNRISVSAEGADAAQVHDAIQKLIDENFGEGPAQASPKRSEEATSLVGKRALQEVVSAELPREQAPLKHDSGPILKGVAVSPGYAVAPARYIRAATPKVEPRQIADPQAEVARFNQALERTRGEIKGLMDQGRRALGTYDARIFEAHLLHLDDPEIIQTVRERIQTERINAEVAWQQSIGEMVASYRALEDTLMRARGDDLADVGARVLRILLGVKAPATGFDAPVILCLEQIKPSDLMALDFGHVQGMCVETGSKTSHAAILVSALGIPAVFGIGTRLREVEEGCEILLDGTEGTLNIRPDDAAIAAMQRKRDAWRVRVEEAQGLKFDPAVTRDGARCRVAANMAGTGEVETIVNSGAEEVGLFRTEFLYMNRNRAPSEEEQFEAYRQIVVGLKGRPLVIRTMDIGGDKPVPYLQRPLEVNPNLGWRGIRYSLDNDALFQTQLRAILRASAEGPVRIMFPMVSTVDEVLAARREVEKAKAHLVTGGHTFNAAIEVGIMVEVPAAAEMADRLASHVNFFSIGTNDLTQYVMASDRGNPKLSELFDPLHPAVLRTIQRAIVAAKQAGIWIGMCGAMAGDSLATPVLLGLGLDEFSMNASQIAEFKLDFSRLSVRECERLAHEVLALETAQQVRNRIQAFFKKQGPDNA